MKNIVTFFIITLSLLLNAQKKGKVVYKVSLDKSTIEKPYENPENTEAKNEALEMLHESQPVEAYLVFNDSVSLYYVEEKVEIPRWDNDNGVVNITPSGINMSWYMAGSANLYYSDWTRNYNISTSEVVGTRKRIKKEPILWDITEETKTINGYLCYKAILTAKENRIAWFTKEIPLPHGPRGFNGLPGLVLEFQNNKYTYLAKSIELDHYEAEEIEEPLEGDIITEEDYRKWANGFWSDEGN
ncbi:GLPGLI family protein [Winogradskyella luteola]|uniref:GLPGLI family protein n=1 Tax=Winogradskyella luteola TaxID=2828330 RepID=A0A9X1JRN8_9FLAO|nr:GLPGLI family protein [Winogradskyella luteola]MBV7270098.1 GLPGLI family protein [Winogradskyella luteola]